MKIEFEATVQVKKSLEYRPINSTYAVFSYTVDRWVTDTTGYEKTDDDCTMCTSHVGIATNKEIDNFSSGQSNSITDNFDLLLVTNDFIESIRNAGYVETMMKFESVLDDTRKNLMDLGGKPEYQLVRNYHGGHMIFDMEDIPLPIAIKFDYINGNITNEDYNSQEVLYTLAKNEQVVSMNVLDVALTISPIPYYNADEKRNAAVEFIFRPTKNQMRDIWKIAVQINPNYPSTALHEAVKRLDLLNIKQCMK